MTAPPLENSTNFGAGKTLTGLNNTLITEPNGFDSVVVKIASVLYIYYTPLLVLLGVIGNLVSVFVFYRSKPRLLSTSQYLSALAISDTIFLLQLLPPWLNIVHITGLFHQEGFCQAFVYTSYVTCCFSAWIVVAFTIERFIAVVYPLQRNSVCTVRRSRYIIGFIAIASILLNVPVVRFASPTINDCNIDYDYLVFAARFNLVDTAASFTVPLAVIIVLNTWIMIGVCRLEKERQQLAKAERVTVISNHIRAIRHVGCPRSQQRVTRMLLIVSSVFVCLNLPAYTMRVIAYACDMRQGEISVRWAAIQQITVMFFNTNFGINFILYCLSGQNFRHALRHTIPRIPERVRRPITFRRSPNSFLSNYTDATSNCGACAVPNRRRREQQYITRWTFDNSRQRRVQMRVGGDIELVQLGERNLASRETSRNRFVIVNVVNQPAQSMRHRV